MRRVVPAHSVQGTVALPGDKSVSHRAALLGALSVEGVTVTNFSGGADCASTLACLEKMGVTVRRCDPGTVHIARNEAFLEPGDVLDAGNSGTTARTLCGLLAGVPGLYAVLSGDESLRRRPMGRVVDPLRVMGARIDGRAGGASLPLCIKGTRLTGGTHRLQIASAQVKTALLLSGLSASEPTTIVEPLGTRDHTERLFDFLGVPCTRRDDAVTIFPCEEVRGGTWRIPGDVSAAAFWLVAAALLPDSEVRLPGCGLNPTRTGMLSVLRRMGLAIEVTEEDCSGGEPVGDLLVRSASLEGTKVFSEEIPSLVDELPVLAVAATQAKGITEIRGAKELRVKECDRIAAMAEGLRTLGADVEELEDGWILRGPVRLSGGRVRSFGDHRIAMAFAVAGLAATGPVEIDDPACVDISYPAFFETLETLVCRECAVL
jgi:3-phosphoshikimate 1-carboxyvinyltransferase